MIINNVLTSVLTRDGILVLTLWIGTTVITTVLLTTVRSGIVVSTPWSSSDPVGPFFLTFGGSGSGSSGCCDGGGCISEVKVADVLVDVLVTSVDAVVEEVGVGVEVVVTEKVADTSEKVTEAVTMVVESADEVEESVG